MPDSEAVAREVKLGMFCLLSAMFLAPRGHAATFTVINNADSGAGSLRQAILDANGNAGSDRIELNIPGAGVHTITPLSALPAITDTVAIDGYTQPGAQANTLAVGTDAVLLVELDGNGGGFDGLTIDAGGCTIRGLVVNRFSLGIVVNGTGNEVSGNYIGVDPGGTLDRGNLFGLVVGGQGLGTDNLIGGGSPGQRNVISGNDERALRTIGDRTTIQGNYIGTDAAGTAALGNSDAIAVDIAADNCLVGGSNATPGGSCTGQCNLISGNAGHGIVIDAFFAVTQNDVRGNYIGTDVTGQTAIPNAQGIGIGNTTSNRIGMAGGTAAERNVISGNTGRGVYFIRTRSFPTTTLNSVIRNYIGLSSSGNPLGNGGHGIELTDTFVTTISENSIAHNGGNGVRINLGLDFNPGDDSTHNRNRLSRNAIFDNAFSPATESRASTALGIDLRASAVVSGVTPNDPGDDDHGANNLQNFPVLDSATSGGGSTQVQGILNSTANTTFLVELFASSSCDPSGFGEGETFVGDVTVTTDISKNAPFAVTLPAIPPGNVITATATDPNGNTSEFSACLTVGARH